MRSASEAPQSLASCLRLVDLPYTRFVLANGLRVVVCRRASSGLIGVNVCYHAGASAEEPGKAGLAHLIEHLMYAGTEHHPQSYLFALERAGATTINADATEDYSTYFETVPAGALDWALWMEAERMSGMLGALDPDNLAREREVIRNEILERESLLFGGIKRAIREHAYPSGHPYRRVALGSMDGLNAITLEDAARWIKRFHNASNALLVIAGDVDSQAVQASVERFFAGVARGSAPRARQPWPAPLAERATKLLPHPGAKSRVYKVWNIPEWSHPDHAILELTAHLLAEGADSVLAQRLAQSRELATEIGVELSAGELGAHLIIYADPAPAARIEDLSEALDQEIAGFLCRAPAPEQLDGARLTLASRALSGLERLTGPGSLTQALAMGELFAANPAFYCERLRRIASADPKALRETAARWLGGAVLTLEARSSAQGRPPLAVSAAGVPVPGAAPTAGGQEPCGAPASRSSRRAATRTPVGRNAFAAPVPREAVLTPNSPAPTVGLPAPKLVKLKNGVTLMLVQRTSAPLAHARLIFRGAAQAEHAQFGQARGLAAMAAAMLTGGGVKAGGAGQIGARLAALGAEHRSRVSLDAATLELSALSFNLVPAIELLAQITLHPAFDPDEFRRLKNRRLAESERERTRPFDFALGTIPRLVFGDSHPYAQPLSGPFGSPWLQALEVQEVADFYRRWVRPELAALVLAGAIDSRSLIASVERLFSAWSEGGPGANSRAALATVRGAPPVWPGAVFGVNRPDAAQSAISVAWPVPALSIAEEAAWLLVRALAADMLSSRLNSRLREQMGATYGVRSFAALARGGGLYVIHTSVPAALTGAAAREVRRELERLRAGEAIAEAEAERARAYVGARLTALGESGAQAADAAEKIASLDLGADYYDKLRAHLELVAPKDIARVAAQMLNLGAATWLIAADMGIAGAQLRRLKFPIRPFDPDDGRPPP